LQITNLPYGESKMKKGFSTKELTQVTQITRARLQEWYARGWVTPSLYEANQPGKHHVWSRADVYSVALFKQLTESGLARKVIGEFISQGVIDDTLTPEEINRISVMLFMRKGEQIRGAAVLGTELEIAEFAEEIGLKGFTDCYLVNFANLKHKIDERIEGLGW
jgi:hypothetical protein